QFPALFEEALPLRAQRWVFKAAFRVDPLWLRVAAISCLALPIGIPLVASALRARRKMIAAPIALGVAATALLVGMRWSETARRGDARPDVLFIAIDSLRKDRLGRGE